MSLDGTRHRVKRLLVAAGRRAALQAARSGPLFVLLLSLERSAQADALDRQEVWLRDYRVGTRCPDRRVFRSWVERRLSVPLARARAGTRLGVSITAESGGAFTGTIEVTDEAGTTTRMVDGASCAEVAEALSLIAAIGLEPNGASERSAPSAAAPPVPPVQDGGALERAPATPLRYEALAIGLFHGAAGPDGAFGAGIALGIESRRGWQPAFRLGAYRVASADVRFVEGDATARFVLIGAQGVFCPVRLPNAGPWGLRPCIELELGRLTGTSAGAAVIGATTRSGVWASGGIGLRVDVDVWGPLRASLAGSGIIPFTRHDFTFTPDGTLAFRVPAFGWQAAVLAGIIF